MKRPSLPILLRVGRRAAAFAALMLSSYALLAYVFLPVSWHRFQERRPAGDRTLSYTAEAIPADPLNVALVGSRAQVVAAMRAAGWLPADRITLSSGWRDVHSVLLDRPYPTAPVSTHYIGNRPQDLAFELQVGRSPRRRHHVRLWNIGDSAEPGKTLWIGAASYDVRVGMSHFTGELMHHIDPAVDQERERLLSDLARAGAAANVTRIEKFRPAGDGRNGGDRYFSDGALGIVVLKAPADYSSASMRGAPSRPDRS